MFPMSVWRHIRAIFLLPFMATVVVPGLIIWSDGIMFRQYGLIFSPQAGWVFRGAGIIALCLGLAFLVGTVRAFAKIGKGTLAPWDPPQRLVIAGAYRHCRHPMISGVTFVLIGEALLTASPPLLLWLSFFLIANMLYLPLVEEPQLLRRFGAEFEEYRRHVPPIWPDPIPWEPDSKEQHDEPT